MKKLLLLTAFCAISAPAYATKVQEIKTPAGITAWLVEEHAQPLLATKIVFRDAGLSHDPDGKEGRGSMSAALLMEGSGDMGSEKFNNALNEKAIRLNMAADEDILQASMETLSENKDIAFNYLGLALTQPRFDSSAIERVASQTRSVLTQQEMQPGYLLQRGWQAVAYGKHPYSKPSLGTKDTISSLSKSDFKDYAKRYLTRENMVIAVVGDISPAELSSLLDKNLAALPAKFDPDTTISELALPKKGETKIVNLDIPQSVVMFGVNGLKRDDPDYFTGYVMNYLIGGGTLTSRLGLEIREKRGLAYAVSTGMAPKLYTSIWQGNFSTRNEKVGEAVTTLKDTLREFVKNGATDAEMQTAKNFLTGSFVLGLDSNAEIANFLISMQLYHLGIDYLDTRNARIRAVTKQQVNAMAKRLIDPDNLLMVIVGKPTMNSEKTE